MRGLSNRDPILADIIAAAKAGHFDRREAEGPSNLEATPTLVLYAEVQMMSRDRRRIYLAQIGRLRGERAMLSGGRRSKRTRLWLSKRPEPEPSTIVPQVAAAFIRAYRDVREVE